MPWCRENKGIGERYPAANNQVDEHPPTAARMKSLTLQRSVDKVFDGRCNTYTLAARTSIRRILKDEEDEEEEI